MPTICFLAVAPNNECRRISYGAPTLEACFDALTQFVIEGWQPLQVGLVEQHRSLMLPAEAFDGQFLRPALDQLRQEWEAILANPLHQ